MSQLGGDLFLTLPNPNKKCQVKKRRLQSNVTAEYCTLTLFIRRGMVKN